MARSTQKQETTAPVMTLEEVNAAIREWATTSAERATKEMTRVQQEAAKEMLEGYRALTTHTVGHVLALQYEAQLWGNVTKGLERAAELWAEGKRSLSSGQSIAPLGVLQYLLADLDDTLVRYTPQVSTSALSNAEDTIKQHGRVEFRRELLREIRWAEGHLKQLAVATAAQMAQATEGLV